MTPYKKKYRRERHYKFEGLPEGNYRVRFEIRTTGTDLGSTM